MLKAIFFGRNLGGECRHPQPPEETGTDWSLGDLNVGKIPYQGIIQYTIHVCINSKVKNPITN
jgi:hypothetical protein